MIASGFRGILLGVALLAPELPSRAQAPANRTLDFNGDPLPDGAHARLGMLPMRNRDDECCLAFAADGKVLATSRGNTVRLWRMPLGTELRAFETRHDVAALVFSPDGKRLATAGRGPAGYSITVWKTAGGKPLAHFAVRRADCFLLAFSPDGKTFGALQRAALAKTTVQIWDVASGKTRVLAHFDGHAWTSGISFARDGKTLAAPGTGTEACIWDIKSGKRLKQFDQHDTLVTVAVFHPDGKHLATGSMDGTIRLWDLTSGKERRRWSARGYIASLAFAANGTVVACGMNHRAWRVHSEKGAVFATFGEAKPALSPDGRFMAVAGPDKIVQLRYLRRGTVNSDDEIAGRRLLGSRPIEKLPDLIGYGQKIRALAWSHDGRVIASAGGDDASVIVWDAGSGEPLTRLAGEARLLVFAPDRRQLVLAGKAGANLWEKKGPATDPRRIAGLQGEVKAAVFSPDGKTLALTSESTTSLLDLVMFPATEPRRLHLLNPQTGKLLRSLPAQEQRPRCLAFSTNGRSLALTHLTKDAVGTIPGIRVLDTRSGRTTRDWYIPDRLTVRALQYGARDVLLGALVAKPRDEATPGLVCWWHARSGRLLRQRPLPAGQFGDMAFSPDGRMLALGGRDTSVRLLDLFAGSVRRTFSGHHDPVNSLAFAAEGNSLVSGSDDTTALVWDVYSLSAQEKTSARPLDDCWRDLGSANAADAFLALRLLLAGKAAAVSVLKRHLQPVKPQSIQHLRILAGNLDDTVTKSVNEP